MLRINLLPAYIAERRKTRLTIATFSTLFVAVTAAVLAFYFFKQGQVQELEAKADNEQREAEAVLQLQATAQTTRSVVQPLLNDVAFVDNVLFFNTLRPKIYRQVAAYTHKNVEYNSMNITGQTLSISAYTKELSDIGRFLITMFGNPDLKAVSVSGPPGWPAGQAGGGGGTGGYPGGGGGGAPSGGGRTSFGAGQVDMGGGGGYPGGAGGGYPGGGGAGGAVQPPGRKGYPFSVTAVLVQPLSPPAPPGVGGGAPGGGGLGGYPGGGGGYPGGSGGYPGSSSYPGSSGAPMDTGAPTN